MCGLGSKAMGRDVGLCLSTSGRHQKQKVSPSCVPRGFLLELLPSKVVSMDVRHVPTAIPSNKPLM